MAKKMYKISKYFKDCYCKLPTDKNKNVIIKFDASTEHIGIGKDDTYMECPFCGSKRHFRIDTWWGGDFSDDDCIYLDTARKEKIKVSTIKDSTGSLLRNHLMKLKQEVTKNKKEFDDSNLKLKALENLLEKGVYK